MKKIMLPSGNWFAHFHVNPRTRTIVYTYHDRRRHGQVARHYAVTFKADLCTIESVIAVSACGGRVELFTTVSIRKDLVSILRHARRAMVETHAVAPEPEHVVDDNLLGILKMLGGMVMGNMIVTLATLGFLWYTL